MPLCLFECLCEADLQQCYPRFAAVGLQKIDELAQITMKDYSRNIHSSGTEADTTCSAKTQNTKTLPHRGSATDLSDGEIPIIHRVAHVLGYNYGVPQTCRRLWSVSVRKSSKAPVLFSSNAKVAFLLGLQHQTGTLMILKGSRERSTGASGVNSDSSRSHAVIQIQMKNSKNRKLGRISFIDLTGSERASDAKESDKQTKLEGAEINQSLLALKECIRALDQEQAHTPFRQSKLTQCSHFHLPHAFFFRVKELKRGTTSHSAHGQPAACVSPKRVQNAPAGSGDKISPKKVKLGQQHISASHQAKSKSCPSVFHPTIIPLSSTPKYCSKSSTAKENARDAGLNHMTPVKGTLRSGASGKKKKNGKTSDGLYPIFQSPTTSNTETTCETRNIKRENFVGTQKVPKVQIIQAVQPVQKEIVPRPGLLANPNYRALSKGLPDEIPRPTVNTVAGRAAVHPQPKEREQHLRSYYKQFQQPPIFQQKLHYQPLEKIFAQYKPQSIKVTSSIDPVHPSSPLEDLDDSDFSEDSFSYSSNHKKGRNEVEVGENISFFLHQDSPVKESGKSAEMKKGLCFSDKDPPLFDQGVGWSHGNNANTQGREHPDKNVMPTSWSSEMDSKHSVHSKARGPCEGCVSVSSHSVSGVMAPLTVSLLQDNWSFWSDPCLAPQELSARSENGAKNLNCIEGWSVDAPPTLGKIPTDEPGGQSHESATDKQCICSNKALKSFCGEKGWFPGTSDTSLDVLLKSNGQHCSRFYDADTEDTTDGLKGMGNGNKAKEESPSGRSTDKNIIDSNDLPASAATDEVLNCNREPPSFKEDFRLPLRDDELECLKAKLLQCLFSQGDLKKEPPPNCVMDIPSPKNSTSVDREICPSKGPGHKPWKELSEYGIPGILP
uniref:Kinesin motor domain-containing protein n=1 Tax=Xenopus tropicalis TaxID=8364 RepID=A0A1B8XVR3_XENTR